MLKAILITGTGQILQTKEMVGVNDFPPAIILVDGLYLLLMLKSPTEAFYRNTKYYLFDSTPEETEEFDPPPLIIGCDRLTPNSLLPNCDRSS